MNLKTQQGQRGVVIVVALFMVALIATIAYVMLSRVERDTYRTRLVITDTQADLYSTGATLWAVDLLRNNWIKRKTNQVIDQMPISSGESEMNGFKIRSTIEDMQARFNINSLSANPEAQESFKHLLRVLSPSLNADKAQGLIAAMLDWIQPTSKNSEFDRYYLSLPSPYQSAHRAMIDVSELNLIKGMTPKLYNVLRPYVTALPSDAQINVQTASLPVLLMVSPALDLSQAKVVDELRKKKPFLAIDNFNNLDIIKNHGGGKPLQNVTVESRFFMVETHIDAGEMHRVCHTLLERSAQGGEANVRIVWQNKFL